jgi:hypothetical protein
MLQAGRVAGSKLEEINFFPPNVLNDSGSTRPWSLLVSNRNVYQKQKNNIYREQNAAGV